MNRRKELGQKFEAENQTFYPHSAWTEGSDEMVGWHHRLNEREFEQTLGDGEGQGSLECCIPWGRKESDMTERLNNNKNHRKWEPTSVFVPGKSH